MKKTIFILLVSVLILSCKEDKSGGSFSNVSGQFNPAVAGGSSLSRAAVSDYQVLYFHGSSSINSMLRNDEIVDIASDGTFSLSIPEGDTFFAFLYDADAAFRKTLGVIGIGTGTDSVWESISTEILEGDIQLGIISESASTEDILLSENNLSDFADQIDNLDEARTMALADNSIRYLKNNINAGDVLERCDISYVLNMSDRAAITDSWAAPDNFIFSGFQVTTWWESFSESDTILLYPPETVTYGNGTSFDPSNPLSGDYFNGNFGFGWGETADNLIQEAPRGYWDLYQNGKKVAELDLGTATPVVDGKFAFPLIVPKVNTAAGSDIITSIDFEWYLLDENGGFQEISFDTLSEFISDDFGVEISDFSQSGLREYYSDISPGNSFTPPDEWHMTASGDSSEHYAEYIGFNYGMGAVYVRSTIRE
ncbi:MAG: hypothetical protein PQJ58_11960 [Spirochaetales bacterium]|nr:hypothetical protein [Spirochaetales bacterium]